MKNWIGCLSELNNNPEATCVEILEGLFQFLEFDGRPNLIDQVYSHSFPKGKLNLLIDRFISKLSGPVTQSNMDDSVEFRRMYWPVAFADGLGIVRIIADVAASWQPRGINVPVRETAIAHAACLAIDEVYKSNWYQAFHEAYDAVVFDVAPGRIFPIGTSLSKALTNALYGPTHRETPAPETKNQDHRVLKHVAFRTQDDLLLTVDLRLYGSDHDRHSMRYRQVAEGAAAAAQCNILESALDTQMSANEILREVALPLNMRPWNDSWPRLATGLLNRWDELRWTNAELNGHDVIREVHAGAANGNYSTTPTKASDPAEVQFERCMELIWLASNAMVDVLVLPELCLTPELQRRLIEGAIELSQKLHLPHLLVFGSSHETTSDGTSTRQQNVSKTLVMNAGRKSPLVDHFKFNPVRKFKGKRNAVDDECVTADEQLDCVEKRITICVGQSSSFCPLICKDCFHNQLTGLWSRLRPKFILAPALSPISGPFQNFAMTAASSGHCLAVIADNGIHEDDVDPGVPDRHRFSIFGTLAADQTGVTNAVHESPFRGKIPSLPRLLVLRWPTERVPNEVGVVSSMSGLAAQRDVAFVEVIPEP
jgi:hypothetical protein